MPPFALPHTNQLLEDHPLWDAGLVATERMVHLSLGQEGTTLLEDRLLEQFSKRLVPLVETRRVLSLLY